MSFVLDCENEKNGFSVEDVLTVPVEQTGPVLPSGTDLGYIGDHKTTDIEISNQVVPVF